MISDTIYIFLRNYVRTGWYYLQNVYSNMYSDLAIGLFVKFGTEFTTWTREAKLRRSNLCTEFFHNGKIGGFIQGKPPN